GGRQPVAWAGPAPLRRADADLVGRRPVVAILDTGCGDHEWLRDAVQRGVQCDGHDIGSTDAATDPEVHPSLTGPMDGAIGEVSGHGTFIAGLIHQGCPDADILSWRVVEADGSIAESDLVLALTRIATLAVRHAAGLADGRAIDVLSLSMGYYHETPRDGEFDPTMYELLAAMGRTGTLVVCSAGNDATERPMFPAAFAPWSTGTGAIAEQDPVAVPILSVGALNPDPATVALFSNGGPWVRDYAPGAAVVSTMPPLFQGGLDPLAGVVRAGRERASIDPDDFRGGFAVWSGTSFSAPVRAGTLAQQLAGRLPAVGVPEDPADARERAWDALEALTPLRRP
ncbi:MAG: hypothetical protein QOE37_154, partial [Microbacteriaceae bacterium]|nr:hypothetical protein [Microbacteriaceae bacterium]